MEAEKKPQEEIRVKVPLRELLEGEYREEFSELVREAEDSRKQREWAQLCRSAETAKQRYPDFDLRAALQNPRFAALAFRGADAQSAWEAANHESLLREAMAYAAQETARRLSAAKRAQRPPENGADGQSAAVQRRDPRNMSKQERQELRRRVLEQGERGITF